MPNFSILMNPFAFISIIISLSALLGFINYKWLKLPSTIGIMALSLIVGVSLKIINVLAPDSTHEAHELLSQFDFSSFVLDFILCFLLFAGSIHVKLTELKSVRASVISYATIGVLISTFVIGFAGYYVFMMLGYNISLITCLLFGALISPTDPIAVMGILKKYNVPKKLEVEIVGESLFNDGVGVVVFSLIYSIQQLGANAITTSNIIHLISMEVVGGIAIGIAIGYVGYYFMRSIDHYQTEILISLAIVMGGYTFASYIHSSGPLAMVMAGLIIGNKGKSDAMSDITAEYVDKFWELIDDICNTILFVLIGLQVFLIPLSFNYIWLGLIFIIVVLVARLISLLPTYFIFHRKDSKKAINLTILTWGGLRGGISIALALSLKDRTNFSELILVVTYCIVLFSILIQGLSLKAILNKL